ncbi:MAG: hypothetical protein IAE79_00160 [Anaerolinea sp.]|nr:hypothetical protein [Anaerolinea sp.]
MKREFKRLTGNRGCYLLYVLIFVSIAGGAMLNAHLVAGVKPSFAANLSFGAILFFVSASLLGLYWQRHKQVTLTKSKLITNTRTAEKIAQYNTIVGQEITESALYLTTFDDQLEISRATEDYGELIALLCQQSDVLLDNAIQFPWKLALQRELPARPFQRHSSASVGDPVKALLFTEYHMGV